mmetsp:Transcript_25947/g.50876  ORF Transcript_25947/g.50876 Transcript_25947/m.50876 type:complete len:113 (-) Transcript_25947:32-370(-)
MTMYVKEVQCMPLGEQQGSDGERGTDDEVAKKDEGEEEWIVYRSPGRDGPRSEASSSSPVHTEGPFLLVGPPSPSPSASSTFSWLDKVCSHEARESLLLRSVSGEGEESLVE